MNTTLLNTLKEMSLARGVSGYEISMGISSEIYKKLFFCKRVSIDPFGNVIAQFGKGKKKVLVEAHLDEVGVCITNKLSKNKYQFVGIGWVDIGYLENEYVEFVTKETIVLGKITKINARAKSLSDFIISTSQELAIGSVGTFQKYFSVNNTLVSAVGLDNRVGCTALIEVARTIPTDFDTEIAFAFTVQEEQGEGRGACTVASMIRPDIAIVVDSAYAQPFSALNWHIPQLGKGPALQMQGRGFVIEQKMIDWAKSIANKIGISYQLEIPDRQEGGTNVKAIQLTSRQTKILGVNIPVRYQDSPRTIADLADIEETIRLLRALLEELRMV